MTDPIAMAAHGADLPISCANELVTNANIGERFAIAHQAPTQFQANRASSIGKSGPDTNQLSDVVLPEASSKVHVQQPPYFPSPSQLHHEPSSHTELLESNTLASFSPPPSHGDEVNPGSPHARAVDSSTPPALPPAHATSPSSSNQSKEASRASSSSTHPRSDPPSPSWPRFNGTAKQIRYEIASTYLHQNLNPDRGFVAAGTAEKVLGAERLTDLFLEDLGPEGTTNLISVVERLKLQPVILVLVQMNCDRDNLHDFEDYYVKSGKTTPRKLPFTLNESRDIFGKEGGGLFFQNQSCYTPVIVEEGRHTIIGNSMRVPIICGRELGKGACGTVFQTQVPKGVWRSSSGSMNVEDKFVATKVFDDKDLFDAEVAMYKTIEKDTTHRNLTKYLGSLQYDTGQGTKHVIFLPQAICNLDAFLTDPTRVGSNPDPGTKNILQYAADILRDAAGLVGGLKHLHNGVDNEDGKDISILHGDIRPQNILVFIDQGRYIWKWADYGLSKTKSREPGRDDTSSPARNGTFISPEAHSGRKVSFVSDLWGLAAVLIVVVTHIVDGPESKDSLVKKFGTARKVEDPDDSHDRFFEGSGDNACVNTHVTQWCDKLRAIAAEKGEAFGEIISDILGFLQNNLLVLDVEKRRQTQAGNVREELISMAKRLEAHARESALQTTEASVARQAAQSTSTPNTRALHSPSSNTSSPDSGQPVATLSVRMKATLKKVAGRIRKWRKPPSQLDTAVQEEFGIMNEA